MGALGCFQRVDLLLVTRSSLGHMGGQVAVTGFPFAGRLGAGAAKPTGRKFNFTATAVTGLNGLMADTAIVRAAGGGHKRAVLIFANGCTKQGYHLLKGILTQKGREHDHPAQANAMFKPTENKLFKPPCQYLFGIIGHGSFSAFCPEPFRKKGPQFQPGRINLLFNRKY